ncbi:hypothetical protein E2562_000647 [Oryza meyeriana var. granulata]|uniref:DUF4005 domain-containing protein n=1 Tax=Oryza meyeriana var. granulata TaxID=110450 RepID=A0A6G1DU76_9ORYZ|nr:hypothetical protein E2562_000647 [Oryza meyeriana var. granulata]
MGKAARWFRNLWGGGGKKEQRREQGRTAAPPPPDRKRWSFAKSSRDSTDGPASAVGGNAAIAKAAEAAWLKSMYNDTEREQSKHAMAVAAATAAAADAAVAAAQAAVEVVRLTSQGPTPSVFACGGGAVLDPRGRAAAAVKIQTAFRGFLAKKALRALKALVKLQALVRGYLVRRQAAATLQSMQALVRAQAAIRAARSSRAAALPPLHLHHHHPTVRPRYSLQERCMDDTRSEHGVAAYSRRLSASIESSSYGYDRSPKIVEVDTGRPKSRSSSSRRASSPLLDAGCVSGEEWCANSMSSPLPCHLTGGAPLPPRIAVATSRHFPDYDWCALEIKGRPATAQSTPRLAHMPVTPTKSVCGASPNCRGYMSSTQSSEAKVRSQSAPKQRPEPGVTGGGGARKRVPLSEVTLEARASLSGVGMQRSCNRVQEAFNFKTAVLSRFDRSSEPAAERDRDLFLQRRW